MSRKAELQNAKRLAAEAQLSALPMPVGEANWARDTRAKARARLLDAGAPARRDEYWRYTNPEEFAAPAALADAADIAAEPDPFEAIAAPKIRFINGHLRADLSDPLGQQGLAVAALQPTLQQDISIGAQLFGQLEARGQDMVPRPLAVLNTAVATQGLVIQATGTAVQRVAYQQIGAGIGFVRHLIRVESGAEFTLLESGTPSNSVIEVDLADGAIFHHVRVQVAPDSARATHVFARIAGNAAFKSFTLTADGKLTRNETVIELVGGEASGHIAGAVLAEGDTHTDSTVFVTHDAVNCESRQVFKNVVGGTAKSIFQGKIYVKEGAQKTDGYQISQAVLLNDGAEFSAKPELEIYADDVACSHGSTTGALDPTAMFYLRSRGVPKAEAEALLIAAFADEAIEEIADTELGDIVRNEVAKWMAGRG
ncbi:MAG: SufD family Fe-S cluster assembly protein [Pseudomonadota bacterium]